MKCPNCGGELNQEIYSNISIDRCNKCGGIWLDGSELDQFEDKIWDDDESKGTLDTHKTQGTLSCPKCSKTMIKFNYRYYDLELDACPDLHGFWLDKGEEQRILDLIKNDKKNNERKIKAEDAWAISLARMKSKSFFNKVRDFFISK